MRHLTQMGVFSTKHKSDSGNYRLPEFKFKVGDQNKTLESMGIKATATGSPPLKNNFQRLKA